MQSTLAPNIRMEAPNTSTIQQRGEKQMERIGNNEKAGAPDSGRIFENANSRKVVTFCAFATNKLETHRMIGIIAMWRNAGRAV